MIEIKPQHEVIARKPHHCSWCDKEIHTGEKYITSTLKVDFIYEWRACSRCKPYGVLVFKWCECDIPLKDVLELCPVRPIIGNRRPKASKTHWVLFMREPEPQEQAALPADDYIDNQTLALPT